MRLPAGYECVAIDGAGAGASVRLCALWRREPGADGARLVTLRTLIDGRVLLGCLCDHAGAVVEWVELFVQSAGAAMSLPDGGAMTNATLEARWQGLRRALAGGDDRGVISTAFESAYTSPVFIDASGRGVRPTIDGVDLTLCTDDAVLAARGLATWGGSLHRYLWLAERGADGGFVSLTPGAPGDAPALASLGAPFDGQGSGVNPEGGLVLVRRHVPGDFERYAAFLGEEHWGDRQPTRSVVGLDGRASDDREAPGDDDGFDSGGLFLGRHGRHGRVVEVFHLKLRLIAGALEAVHGFVRASGRPVLRLGPESFAVGFGQAAPGLPRWWTARVALTDGGDAYELPLGASGERAFASPSFGGGGVYRPDVGGQSGEGVGEVRIRGVSRENGQAVLEGTLSASALPTLRSSGLIWLRLATGDRSTMVYARPAPGEELTAGEVRFRSLALVEASTQGLSEGAVFREAAFRVMPALGAACDLHALGVLAAKTLLVGGGRTLGAVLDELRSLASAAGSAPGGGALHERIVGVVGADSRWAESLGPQGLTEVGVSSDEAFDLVPPELWWKVVAWVVRMFPGSCPSSFAKDAGDAPPGGQASVFESPRAEMRALLTLTRSLIVIDWRQNREVARAIRSFAAGG
ncbi:MAG: hypothetical protein EA378_04790 [Phycisphaerales bacterium]|nr:MAG: hypothetical protein EA378_04790 [Phycisphaerales bacterium]